MTDLIVVSFDTAATAFALRDELVKIQQNYLLDLEDIVVVTHETDGKVNLHQTANLTAMAATSGGFWGLLVGMFFLSPLTGAAIGAGAGALSAQMTDMGINDEFMRGIGENLTPGTAALFVLVRKFNTDKVVAQLGAFHDKGHIMQTSLSHDDEEKLRAALEAKAA